MGIGFGWTIAQKLYRISVHTGWYILLFKMGRSSSLQRGEKKTVATFIRTNIIYRYGVSRCIITYNEKQFDMSKMCAQLDFKQHHSSAYHAPANGLAETFNKTLCNFLKKVANRSKKYWPEKIE